MRRRIFVFLIALVLVALAATAFVACDPKGQTGTGGLLGEEQETFTEVVTPDYLKVLNPTTQAAQAFPADFSVADITYQVVYNVETKSDLTGKTVSAAKRYGERLTATADMLSAESLENLNHPGTHTVTLTLVVDGVSVSGETKVYLKDSAIPTHLVTVNYKAAGGEDKVVAKNIKEDSVLPYGASFLRKFGISSSYVDADGVTQYLAYFDIAGQDANFAPDDLTALTVTSPVTLTAVYSPEKKPSYTVTYVTAAPADIIWSDGNLGADEEYSASVVQGGTVSEIRNNSVFRSDNYTLVGWVKEDGTAFNFASDRVYSDTVITAKWQKRTFKASVSLSGGSFDAGYAASDLQSLSEVKTESVFDASGKLTGVTFTGIEYGRALSEFYASILLDKAGTAVLTVPLTVLFDASLSPIVRSGYELDGIYNGENAYDVSAAVTRALSLIAHWTPDTSSIDEDYFENTFEFEKLIDGTYAITRVKDARAALVYVPAEYKGLPVTRIEANAAKDNSSVTTLDLTAASNLTYIGANAFGGCVSLSEIRSDAATSKLSRIEAGAFDGINYDLRKNGHLIVGKVLVLAKTRGGEADLSGEQFEYIAGGAFSDTNLTKLKLPDGLKGIADGAFAAANPTGDIVIVAHTTSMEYLGSDIGLASFSDGSEDNMLAIGNALYRYMGNDASVTLVNNGLDITVIAGGAFADSPSVTELVKTTEGKDIVYIGEDAFHDNFVAAHTDANGLFVYDGILVKYYGSAKQVTLTDEVRVINTGAFKNAGLSNLIIPSRSALEPALKHIKIKTGAFRNAGGLNITVRAKESAADIDFAAEVSAFTNWNGAVYVEYRPDRNTSGTPGMSTQALYDSLVNDSAMWQWLEEENKMFAVEVASVSLSAAKVPTVFVTDADGKVDFYASALGWGNNSRDTVFKEGDTYSIYDAVTARRNDGLTDTEDFVIKQSDLNAQFDALLGEPATEIAPDSAKTGIITFTAKDSTIPADLIPDSAPAGTLAVSVYPGIESIDILNADGESTEQVSLFTSYSDNIVDNFVLKDFTAVVTYTNGAETRHVFSKSGTSITMAGYDKEADGGTLVFSYTYAYPSSGLTSTGTAELAYTMQKPRPTELTLADDVAVDDKGFHVALGAQVGGLYSQLRFTVGYNDGLTSETVVPGDLLSITELSTDKYGEGVAKVTYNGEFAGEARTIELKYFVDASPQSYFDFVFVDKGGNIVKNGDGPYYATDTDAFVLPTGYENYTVAVYWLREDTSAKRLAIPETIVAGGQTFAVTHIVNGAFSAAAGGNNITYIYIPSSVVSIGEQSFAGASSLRELDLRHASGLKVIGKEAFKGTISLDSVDLSKTAVTVIGESAFQGSGLNKVTLGGVKKIEGSAFNGAAALRDIDLSGVTDIGAYAFEDCAKLSGIVLTSLRTLGGNAFEGCTALSEIVTPGTGDLYGGNGGVLVAYGEVVAVSDTATDIVIPAGVTVIADYAFEGKDQVVTLSVAADFTLDLVDLAKRFPLLKAITVESGNPNYLSDAGALYNAAGTELLFIPVKYPGALIVREGVTALDAALFDGRAGITALTIPVSVSTIENGAFDSLVVLESITVNDQNSNYMSLSGVLYNRAGTNVIFVPARVTSVDISEVVTTIADGAFSTATALVAVNVDAANTAYSSVGGVLYNKAGTELIFVPAMATAVNIPATVNTIREGAFSATTALTAITVDAANTVYSSVDGVLYDKAGTTLIFVPARVTSVDISATVTTIADGAFSNAAALAAVNVDEENTVYSSVGGVLYNKAGTELIFVPAMATTVNIPATVVTIREGAFSATTALTAITVDAANTVYSSVGGVLYDKAGTTLLLVPATKLSDPVIIADGVTNIAAGALGSDAVTVYSRSTAQGSVNAVDPTVTVAYYSADDPYAEGADPEGVFWHEVEGEPVLWEKQLEVTE